MDYKELHDVINNLGQVTNIDNNFMLFYDETNNPRTFKLTDTGFNFDEHKYFVLGGIGFLSIADADEANLTKLFVDLKLQKNSTEIKFRHIKQNAKNFIDVISKPRVNVLLNWIKENKAFIHYSYVDNFYYTIVDIVDSLNEPLISDNYFNREIKNKFYSLILKNEDSFQKILIEFNYPNIFEQKIFIETLIDWIEQLNIYKDTLIECLRQYLKQYIDEGLVFLQDNQDNISISNYVPFYEERIYTFSNGYHLFDHEYVIEKEIQKNPMIFEGRKMSNYDFVDSKDIKYIQISDLCINIIRLWLEFIEQHTSDELYNIFNEVNESQQKNLKIFKEILVKSVDASTGFKHGVVSNDFERRVNLFFDFKF